MAMQADAAAKKKSDEQTQRRVKALRNELEELRAQTDAIAVGRRRAADEHVAELKTLQQRLQDANASVRGHLQAQERAVAELQAVRDHAERRAVQAQAQAHAHAAQAQEGTSASFSGRAEAEEAEAGLRAAADASEPPATGGNNNGHNASVDALDAEAESLREQLSDAHGRLRRAVRSGGVAAVRRRAATARFASLRAAALTRAAMLDESVNAARARLATAERDFGAPKEPAGGAAARARAPDASSGSDSRGVLNAAQEHELQRLRDGAARALQAEEKEHVAALERLRHDGNVKAFDAKEEAEQQREQVRQDAREHVERWTKGELAQIEASTRHEAKTSAHLSAHLLTLKRIAARAWAAQRCARRAQEADHKRDAAERNALRAHAEALRERIESRWSALGTAASHSVGVLQQVEAASEPSAEVVAFYRTELSQLRAAAPLLHRLKRRVPLRRRLRVLEEALQNPARVALVLRNPVARAALRSEGIFLSEPGHVTGMGAEGMQQMEAEQEGELRSQFLGTAQQLKNLTDALVQGLELFERTFGVPFVNPATGTTVVEELRRENVEDDQVQIEARELLAVRQVELPAGAGAGDGEGGEGDEGSGDGGHAAGQGAAMHRMNVEHESVHGWLSGHGAPVSVANVRSRSDLAVASLYAELDRTQPFNDEDEEDDEGQEAALREQLRRVDEQHAGRLNRKMLDAKVSSSKSKSKRARRGVSKSK